jgi:hypothetical protein
MEAPSFTQAKYLYAPQLDGQAGRAGTFTQAATDDTAIVLVNGTELASDAFARSFEEQLADIGGFSFQVLRSDYLAAPIAFEDQVAIRLDGVDCFPGYVELLDHVAIAQGEDADETVTVHGRNTAGELESYAIGPSRGSGVLPIEDTRTLSWVSADYSATASGWPLAKTVNFQSNYAGTGAPRPHIWPDTTGKWIWGNVPGVTSLDAPQGICLFRKAITLADTATCRFFFAGDNVMRIWIDGAEMTWFAGSAVGRYVEIELSAGGHYIAAKVANKVDVPGENNPAGFILVGYTVNGSGLLDTKIVETDTTWRCLPYPVRAPGFTDGKAIRLFFQEAGLDSEWTLDFTDTKDSDGNPWTYQREIAVNVGRSILEYLRERAGFAIDFAVAPGGSKILRAWNFGGRGVVRSTTLQQTTDPATSDFLALTHAGKRTHIDGTLIRYADGHTEEGDAGKTGYLEIGHVLSEEEAQEIAAALRATRSEPTYSTTATLHPRSDATTPYKGFHVGDWIACPNETDTPELMRVNSIAWTPDENGESDWVVTLRDVRFEEEEKDRVWLRRMADGVLIGGARVSSRKDTPAPTAQQITVLKVAEFSYDNSALTESRSPKRPAEQSGNIVQIYGQLTTAGSSTTAVAVYKNGSLLTTLNFGAGDTEDWKAVDIVPVIANVDKLQVEITAAGTGAEGLDVQVRGI